MLRIRSGILVLVVSIVFTGLYFLYSSIDEACAVIPEQRNEEGTQGYRIWSGESLRSFNHSGRPVCVPEGWQAVGAIKEGEGWAIFAKDYTGVIIKSDAFGMLTLNPEGSPYTVKVLYPLTTASVMLNRYLHIVTSAFSNVEKLFPGSDSTRRTHVVLVTALLAGNTNDNETRIYPDQTEHVSMFVRTPDYSRAEELFVHAVMHLFNRQRTDLTAYQVHQDPFSPEDWQEMEAAWSETALSTWNEGKEFRVRYMYNVHTAVRTNNFSLIASDPFNDKEAFEKIHQSAVVEEGSASLDYQYGHYVLGPLVMIAIEGLLQNHTGVTHVADLLRTIHQQPSTNFFTELEKTISKDEVSQVMSWIHGEETIPEKIVMKGLAFYAHQLQ